jgi:peptidoglycan lytic transglycosylase
MNVAGPFFRTVACALAFSVAAYPASNPLSASAAQTAAPNTTPSAAPKVTKPAHQAHPQPQSDSATASAKRLEALSRQLKQKNPGASYSQLSVIASQKSSGILGMRAALALGYYDLNKNRYAEAVKWLEPAQNDPLLRDYALFYSAEANIALNKNGVALGQLKQFRNSYPDSVLTEQALAAMGTAALSSSQPAELLAALDSYPALKERPALLFLRAEAYEQTNQPLKAAADYQKIYYVYATAEQAREAGEKLGFLRSTLGNQLPAVPIEKQLEHAAAIFSAKQWTEARDEYSRLLPLLKGADQERAELRILLCGLALGSNPSQVAALKINDADVDAERYYSLANHYRNQSQEAQMVSAIDAAIARDPASRSTEAALFLGGNYYWVQLDRDRAVGYYKRLADNFPTATDATPAQWRVAWAAVLKRQSDASELLIDHVRRFPASPFAPDALYWLGRLAEESDNPALARAYYEKLQSRFPQNYFSTAASAHLRTLGPGPVADAAVLASVQPLPASLTLGPAIPAAAANRQARADALRSIGFDASAELELRAAYAATGEPRLLLEAAQEAATAGRIGVAIVTVRQIYPQLEWRRFEDVPREVWLAAYAMPFQPSIRSRSAAVGLDPMLTAGLIRQESAYQPEAHSVANAFGLMQLLPKTARRYAKQAKVRYSTPLLFEPDYNIHLGTIYLAGLRRDFGSVESALAAYNAGEERVAQWTAGQTYREPAEFVDSIPFTETREYVEIVTRNADIYRKLYGAPPAVPAVAKSPAATRSAVKTVKAKPIRGAHVESRKTGTSAGE